MIDADGSGEPVDLLGVGIGPFNLSLAAMADGAPGLRAAFLEQQPEFRWHPGLMIEGTTLQVPFLADLVSLVEPTSPWSFLSYLRTSERLFPFYFAERFHMDRFEYEAYCRWVSGSLPSCHFGYRVESVVWDEESRAFDVRYRRASSGDAATACRHLARNVVLGIGTEPVVPEPFRELLADRRATVLHSADYLAHRAELLAKPHVTVVGSGQSGAEVFLDLLRNRPAGGEELAWISRSAAFAPMEYSKLGLEQFAPDYTDFFRRLPESERDRLLPSQWQLYKAVSAGTLGEIHDELYRRTAGGCWPTAVLRPATRVCDGTVRRDRLELLLKHVQQPLSCTVTTDAVVLATGYADRQADPLLPTLARQLRRDGSGRVLVDAQYRLAFDRPPDGSIFVQNAERHTHGIGAPDLGLAAWRSAVIVNAVAGCEVYKLPARTAFTTFGLAPGERRWEC